MNVDTANKLITRTLKLPTDAMPLAYALLYACDDDYLPPAVRAGLKRTLMLRHPVEPPSRAGVATVVIGAIRKSGFNSPTAANLITEQWALLDEMDSTERAQLALQWFDDVCTCISIECAGQDAVH